MRRRVMISGAGVFSPAGRGVDPLFESIERGVPTVAPDAVFGALGMRCALFGRLSGVDAAFDALPIEPAHRDFFGRFARIGAIAAFDAIADAGSPAIGRVLVASGVGPMGELEACFRHTLLDEKHPHRSRAVTRVTPSFLATYLAGAIGAPRGGHMISSACVSALEAFRDAVELVANRTEDAVLVGAVDEDAASTFWAFDSQRLLSAAPAVDARTRALSGKRAGFIPAGGAAFFVVEGEEIARARGRDPAVSIKSVNVRSVVRPESLVAFPSAAYTGVLEAVRGDVFDLVLAHSPPTASDADELAALDQNFDIVAKRTPVRSFKSLFGYALGAAAAIDIALGVAQIERGRILPNDLAKLEPEVERFAPSLLGGLQHRSIERVLKTAYAQGGVAGAIVLERGASR